MGRNRKEFDEEEFDEEESDEEESDPTEIGERVEEILEGLSGSAQFCVWGERDAVLPGLVLGDGTDCTLPLQEVTVQKMIRYADPAPYGLGEKTLIDTDVRKCWQIDADNFSFRNRRWKAFLDGIVEEVCGGLGVTQEVRCDPYKLLIYEAGGFFKAHRDTEKQKGMFATLVINLPCPHQGGTLLVHHDGESESIDFGGEESAFAIQFAAFYADCLHEILPLESGYRVNLVYNLCLSGRQSLPKAPSYDEPVRALASLLDPLLLNGSVEKIAIPLKHQYTEEGLSPDALKGQDTVRFICLSRLAQVHGMQAFLALLTFHQAGTPSIDFDGYRRGRWYDDEPDDSDEYTEFEEIHDEDAILEHWWTSAGESLPLGSLPFYRNEFVSAQPLEEFEYEQTIQGPTGNEGVSMERWYRIAAVVLWKTEAHFHILARYGQATSIVGLLHWMSSVKDPSKDASCRAFAGEILSGWQFYSWYRRASEDETVRMLMILRDLADVELIRRFLVEVLPKQQSGTEGPLLQELFERWGWKSFSTEMEALFRIPYAVGEKTRLARTARIIEDLCVGATPSSEQQVVCQGFASVFFETLRLWDSETNQQMPEIAPEDRAYLGGFWSPHPGISERREKSLQAEASLRVLVFLPYCRALAALGMHERLADFLSHAFQYEDLYDLRGVLVPAIQTLGTLREPSHPCNEPIHTLFQYVVEQLEQRTAIPIPAPTDWSQVVKLGCKCEDCRDLQLFLKHPTEQTRSFAIAEKRRQHLEQAIKQHRLDVEHTTLRKGSPYKLICTKTRTSYEEACRIFEEDIARLEACRLLLVGAKEADVTEMPQPKRRGRPKKSV